MKRFKLLDVMFYVFLLVSAAMVSGLVVYATRPSPPLPPPPSPPGLCEYVSPRPVTSAVVHVGGTVTELRQTCTHDTNGTLLNVIAFRSFVSDDQFDESGRPLTVPSLPAAGAEQARGPGVQVVEATFPVPAGVTVGAWHLSGADLLPSSGEFRVWSSVIFPVVE